MAFYFCGEKTPFCYGMLFWFKSVETILYQITQKHLYAEITCLMIQTTIFTFINNGRIKIAVLPRCVVS